MAAEAPPAQSATRFPYWSGQKLWRSSVGDKPKSKEVPGSDIARSLARHGDKAEINEIIATDIDGAT